MDQNSNPDNPENQTPPENAGGPSNPPSFNDPEPPAYGDPMTPPPAGPPPTPPAPGLDPGPASAPPPPNFNTAPPAGTTGTLTNPTQDERNWAMFAHLSGIVAAFVLSITTLPALGFIGPMVIYLMKKDESAFIGDQAKEALNFNISIGIVMFVLWLLSWTIILIILTAPLMIITGVTALVFVIIAAVKSNAGELYRYPFSIRFIK